MRIRPARIKREEEVVFTRKNRWGSAQLATRATPTRSRTEESLALCRTREEEVVVVVVFTRENRGGSDQLSSTRKDEEEDVFTHKSITREERRILNILVKVEVPLTKKSRGMPLV